MTFSDNDMCPATKQRYVFRISRQTLQTLNERCTDDYFSKSEAIRNAMARFNSVGGGGPDSKNWKLLSPRGANLVSVWADPEQVGQAKAMAASKGISLNHYLEMALKATLATVLPL